jgi:transglutaminase-like putative cysteine protease
VPLPASVTVPDLLRSQTERYTTGATTPAAQVEAIRAGLARDGFFSHGRAGEPASPAGHGLDRLVGMVGSGSMLGDQEQYAALMAVMVRSLGIPARVVVGFAPGTTSGDVPVELRGQDITAWVEVPFEGFGWVAFDPTPSPDKPVTDTQERAQTERRAVSVEEPPALPQIPPDTADTDAADQQPQEPAPPAPAESPTFLPALVLTMLAWTAAVLALVAAPVVAILVIKSRRRRRRLAAPKPADRITGGWQQLLDTAATGPPRGTPAPRPPGT